MSKERIDELLTQIKAKGSEVESLAVELGDEVNDVDHFNALVTAIENLDSGEVMTALDGAGLIDGIIENYVDDDVKSEYLDEAIQEMSDWQAADMIRDHFNVRKVMSELKSDEDWEFDNVKQYISNAQNDECNEVLYLCWQEVGDSEFASYVASNILPNLGAAERVELSKLSDSDDDLKSILLSCVDKLTYDVGQHNWNSLAEYLIRMRGELAAEVCKQFLPSLPRVEADCAERWWQGTDLPTIMMWIKVKAEEGTGYYERILEIVCGELGFDKAADILISRVPEVAIAANREISPDRYMLGAEAMHQIEQVMKEVLGKMVIKYSAEMRVNGGDGYERGEYSSSGGGSVPHISGERANTDGNSGGDVSGGDETYLCDSPNKS